MINKNTLRESRGITMVTLVITVLLLIIITSTLASNAYNTNQLSKLTRLENDIEALNDRIAAYYVEHDKLPVYGDAYTKSDLTEIEDLSLNDGEYYYMVDMSEIDNITLNYGRNSLDAFIINEESHVIYYLEGVTYQGKVYHTVGENVRVILNQ